MGQVIIRDVVEQLNLQVVAGEAGLGNQITGGYVGDLLSGVMAGARSGDLWVTVQGHPNVVAVAVLVGISGVVVAEGARVDPATLKRAGEKGIPILSSQKPAFSVAAALAALGVKGG